MGCLAGNSGAVLYEIQKVAEDRKGNFGFMLDSVFAVLVVGKKGSESV
jgi:hypothetical protein